ncbi:PREDICTED: uncharacterized protein LOC108561345 [Nicrophorus vespilloides]|uniref:Uncharacterized protein LOC108561345 n=1 Tax=Nicrophorus vespilloides TaxID=110193 RepID=A0ABM1MJH0_NICVS|nr:PREDICTED: uncharacterized protein LOC108561345 [Nicrophorus vespilloides]XP_017774720.1 PREDICTED: uncharacterized protein LOC108561345 [Nicrophorus vespilloides]
MKTLALIFTLILAAQCQDATTTTTLPETTMEVTTALQPIAEVKNKTLSELVKEQTETIKKILLENKQYPEMKEKAPSKVLTKQEKEKQSIEELRLKCMNFFKLGFGGSTTTTTPKPIQTIIPFGPVMKPEFLRPKPVENGNFFYIAHQPADVFGYRTNNKLGERLEPSASEINEEFTEKPFTTISPVMDETATNVEKFEAVTGATPNQKYKYVKLEPLVLQKTMLTNGKTYFYWYKPLPSTQSFVQIPDIPENENVETVAQPQSQSNQVPLPAQYQYYLDPKTGSIIRNSKPPQPTTTETPKESYNPAPKFYINPQTGMIYQHANPQIVQQQQIETQTEKVPDYTITYQQTEAETPKPQVRYMIPMLLATKEDLAKLQNNPKNQFMFFPSYPKAADA